MMKGEEYFHFIDFVLEIIPQCSYVEWYCN